MIREASVARRTTDGIDWIGDVCRQFTDAVGWPLRFAESNGGGEVPRRDRIAALADSCWSRELVCNEETLGQFYVDLPDEPASDRQFLAVSELADLLVDLVSRLLATSQKLDANNRDLSLLLNVEQARQPNNTAASLEDLLRVAAELSGFQSAAFFLLSTDAKTLRLRISHAIENASVPHSVRPLNDLPPDVTALRNNRFLIAADDGSTYRSWLPESCTTGLCVPVHSDAGLLGTLWLYDRRSQTLDKQTEATIGSIARRIGAALEHAVLLKESMLFQRQNRDLQVASQCQKETIGSISSSGCHFELASICSSRYELGGDLCEAIYVDEDRTVIIVGDASGDSVPAAMVMSTVRGAIHAMLCDDSRPIPSPAEIVQRANQTLCALSANHQFMSLIVGVLDSREHTLAFANAGHLAPLLLRDRRVRELSLHDLLLGVASDATFSARTVSIQPGDVLVLYTDGISEAMDADGQLFGVRGISQAIRATAESSAGGLLQSVLRSAEEHVDSTAGGDDRSIMVLRVK